MMWRAPGDGRPARDLDGNGWIEALLCELIATTTQDA
jgi:hypothetical protein